MYGPHAVLTILFINLFLTWTTLLLRCYVRIRLVRGFWWDDAFACAALVRIRARVSLFLPLTSLC